MSGECLHFCLQGLNPTPPAKSFQGSAFFFSFFKKRFYLFIFRERGKEGEREGEKHQCVVASLASPTGDLARNPGMCPDWDSNQQPFGSQACAQSTELHQPGLSFVFKSAFILLPVM